MLEVIAVSPQTVAAGQNVLFTNTALSSGCGAERYRNGSGIITLAKPGIYLVTANADIAIPTGGTVLPITAALSVDGEALAGSVMTSTPATTGEYNNVSTSHLIRVCAPCCVSVGMKNTSTQAINFQNVNVTVERKA